MTACRPHHPAMGRIIARAWSEPQFARRLLADPEAALSDLGLAVPAGKTVRVCANRPRLTHIVLPSPRYTETLSAYAEIKEFGEVYRDPRLAPLNWASRDPVLTARLKSDPKAVLAGMGVTVAEAMALAVVVNTTALAHLVVPARPEDSDLTEAVMARIAQGWVPSCLRHAALEGPVRYDRLV